MGIRLRSNGDSLAGGTPAFGGPAPAQELLDMRRGTLAECTAALLGLALSYGG